MTTAELRQAAERIVRWEHCGVADIQQVAQAFLAEHPADDEELVTEEWLRAVGFEMRKADSRWCRFDGRVRLESPLNWHFAVSVANDGHFAIAKIGRFGDVTYLLEGQDLTRGTLRGICRLFRVPIKETP